MNLFEKILLFLQTEMPEPEPFGWFHILCISIMLIMIFILFLKRKNYSEKQLKTVLGTYAIIAFILETLKQLTWSFNYDLTTNLVTWNYEWYAFPFQLCTTPIYVCLICLFLKKGKVRDYLFSFLSYVTILGSISTILLPESCFVEDILVNIHTMWLHLGSFVISVYLLINKEVKKDIKSLRKAIITFLCFVLIALFLNIIVYNSGILHNETFNMFYISPYFISSLPVFDIIQQNVPYILYLIIYIVALSIGSSIIYLVSLLIEKIFKRNT